VKPMADLARQWREMSEADKAGFANAAHTPSPVKPRRPRAPEPQLPSERTPFGLGDDLYPLAHDRINDLVTGAPHERAIMLREWWRGG